MDEDVGSYLELDEDLYDSGHVFDEGGVGEFDGVLIFFLGVLGEVLEVVFD